MNSNDYKFRSMEELLPFSLCYPACALDPRPVHAFLGRTSAFVYIDYAISKRTLRRAAPKLFESYKLVASREVSKEELAPAGGLLPCPEGLSLDEARSYRPRMVEPHALHCVFANEADEEEGEEPEVFDFLFIAGDGVPTYHAIYSSRGIAPMALAIIQPGCGFGNNWTDFYAPDEPLAQIVRANAAGLPNYLLMGGICDRVSYQQSCWPEYPNFVAGVHASKDGYIGLWSRKAAQ